MGHYVFESWVPDWRAQAAFDSTEHEKAVKISQQGHIDELANTPDFPDGIDVDVNGRAFLHVRGQNLLEPILYGSDQVQLRDQTGRPRMVDFSGVQERGDVIWVPWIVKPSSNSSSGQGTGGVGFVLGPGQTQTSYRGRPVYRLRRCFLLPSILFEDDIGALTEATLARERGVLDAQHDGHDAFYLE